MEPFDVVTKEIVSKSHPMAPSIPVRGYIIKEDDERLWLRDQGGTWLISKKDIVTSGEWQGTTDPRFSGHPTLLFIREGADIYELKQFTVRIVTPPITLRQLGGAPVHVKGNEVVAGSSDDASREIGIRPNSGISALMAGGRTTVCCWDSGDWETTCQGDDSGN